MGPFFISLLFLLGVLVADPRIFVVVAAAAALGRRLLIAAAAAPAHDDDGHHRHQQDADAGQNQRQFLAVQAAALGLLLFLLVLALVLVLVLRLALGFGLVRLLRGLGGGLRLAVGLAIDVSCALFRYRAPFGCGALLVFRGPRQIAASVRRSDLRWTLASDIAMSVAAVMALMMIFALGVLR